MYNIPKTFIVLNAILPLILTGITIYIMIRQNRIEKNSVRAEVFDKRYPVYIAVKKYLHYIISQGTIKPKVLADFKDSITGYQYLFGNKLKKHIEELKVKGLKLENIQRKIDNLDTGAERNKLCDEETNLKMYFSDQSDKTKELFSEYLDLSKL